VNLARLFVHRPIATTLLLVAITLSGALAFFQLPIAPLPQVDFPTLSVNARLPGASPETMAATVATPLERSLTRIAGITEMTSVSNLGSTNITLQFDLDRNIDGAARDVQAAIAASRALLPTGLPSNPTYRKVNPGDSPIMVLAMTSSTMKLDQIYDAADTILAQHLAQIQGIGQVVVGGSSAPAVRISVNPTMLSSLKISDEDVRSAIAKANPYLPKGALENNHRRWQIRANDQSRTAADYKPVIVAWRNGAPVRLEDIATVTDSVQDLRNIGMTMGKPSVILILYRQPGANIIDTINRVKAVLPQLEAVIPSAIDLVSVMDRSPTILAALKEVERTLLLSVALVVLVVYLFLKDAKATLIPGLVVPISLIGTFGAMYLLDYSLDSFSMMALTIATGFVVDDAIVVLENISRYRESGMPLRQAVLKGAGEVSFTVVSISLSLIAVFLPILLMGGIVGRLFREFAVTMSVSILISMVISLTATPMMCDILLKEHAHPVDPKPRLHHRLRARAASLARWPGQALVWGIDLLRVIGRGIARFKLVVQKLFDRAYQGYAMSIGWALDHKRITFAALLVTICVNIYLYKIVPKGFFPQQDNGRIVGFIQADQSISFTAMQEKLETFINIIKDDPSINYVSGFTGNSQRNSGIVFMSLKPLSERKASADEIVARLRPKLGSVAGANLFLVPIQDVRIGGRLSNAQFQYTLQSDDLGLLREWEPKIRAEMMKSPMLVDVNTDQQDKGLQMSLNINRDRAFQLGVTPKMIDAALNNYFGQRQVSTIYRPMNQYRVVLDAESSFTESPESLRRIFVTTATGKQIPFSEFSTIEPTRTPLQVNHEGAFVAATISFNLPLGASMSDATAAVDEVNQRLGVPTSIRGKFAGNAKAFQQSLKTQPLLILAAIIAVYIVLGMLYESLIHPLTILSTLPSAGVGALLALLATGVEFSVIALIGVVLLIGIVKKNAIMMVDFAINSQRAGATAREAIHRACLLRFRPILMTTMAALFGAIPLALGHGEGAELRQPLGIAIVGGLILSQLLTLYTTPVVYLLLDRFASKPRVDLMQVLNNGKLNS
jgi:multidrug efflux pump